MNKQGPPDFSYGYFRQILQVIRSNFATYVVAEGSGILHTKDQPQLILRHDIDVSLKRTLKMAEIENDFGVRATYMVMPNSLLYQVDDKASRDILRQLIAMGHEVALHFDLDDDKRNSDSEISGIEAEIDAACKQLEKITDQPVLSISFHRPMPQFLRGPLFIAGRINAYAQELMAWYISDSKGNWRDGDPLTKLLRPEKSLLQLLIHPIWWGDQSMLPADRLQEFFDAETQGQSRQNIERFDADLAKTVPAVRCRGFRRKGEEEWN